MLAGADPLPLVIILRRQINHRFGTDIYYDKKIFYLQFVSEKLSMSVNGYFFIVTDNSAVKRDLNITIITTPPISEEKRRIL